MNVLFDCIEEGTCPEKVVAFGKKYLTERGFQEIDELFQPEFGGKYYMSPYPDVLFAFTTGKTRHPADGVRMAFAHTDQPCFKVKQNADMKRMDSALLNVEVYGGINDHTWFDRPLGMSGSVALKGEDVFHPEMRIYESGRPIAIIPGLAIHMNRDVRNGWKIDRQKELIPVMGLVGEEWTQGMFVDFLAEELGVKAEDILFYDLNLYNYDPVQFVGIKNELVCAPRIDNLSSVSALLEAIADGEREDGINLIGLFNHEEIGSETKSGADSALLRRVVMEILRFMGCSQEETAFSLKKSYYLSVDVAHASHPNYPEKSDPCCIAYIGQGVAIKSSGLQRYATDCKMSAIVKGLADEENIPLQIVQNHNNIRGGSTIGPIIGSQTAVTGSDIGIPIWAMHSARETMAGADYDALKRLVTVFFKK